jgi:hypothetical protein
MEFLADLVGSDSVPPLNLSDDGYARLGVELMRRYRDQSKFKDVARLFIFFATGADWPRNQIDDALHEFGYVLTPDGTPEDAA